MKQQQKLNYKPFVSSQMNKDDKKQIYKLRPTDDSLNLSGNRTYMNKSQFGQQKIKQQSHAPERSQPVQSNLHTIKQLSSKKKRGSKISILQKIQSSQNSEKQAPQSSFKQNLPKQEKMREIKLICKEIKFKKGELLIEDSHAKCFQIFDKFYNEKCKENWERKYYLQQKISQERKDLVKVGIHIILKAKKRNIQKELFQLLEENKILQYWEYKKNALNDKKGLIIGEIGYIEMKEVFKQAKQNNNRLIVRRNNQKIKQVNLKVMEIIDCLANSSIICFKNYWRYQLKKFLEGIIQNMEIYSYNQKKTLQKLVRIYQYRSFNREKLYEIIYEGIGEIMISLRLKLKLIPISNLYYKFVSHMVRRQARSKYRKQFLYEFKLANRLQMQQMITQDELAFNYERMMEMDKYYESKWDSSANVSKEQLQLKNAIAGYPKFYTGYSDWQDILTILGQKVKREKGWVGQLKSNRLNFDQIEKYELPNTRCFGCTTFLYRHHSVRDDSVNIAPVQCFYSCSDLREFGALVREIICKFMNGGGGVILFGTYRELRNIFGRGDKISLSEQQQLRRVIEGYLPYIYPQIQVNKEIRIDFIPMADILINDSQKQKMFKEQFDYDNKKYTFIPGVYILRIRVCPIDSSKPYMIKQDLQQLSKMKCYIRKKEVNAVIGLKNIRKLIKRRIKQFYVNQTQRKRFLQRIEQNLFGHECVQVEQVQQRILRRLNNKQNEFKNMCLMLARKQNLQEINKKMNKNGIKCAIVVKFQDYKFKSSQKTAILYHNLSNEQIIQRVTNNKQFNIKNQRLLLIDIKTSLRFSVRSQFNKISRETFQNYCEWLKKDFPEQVIELYEYNEQKSVKFYLQTQTKTASLFLYYFLTNYNERVAFKGPKNIDQLALQELNKIRTLVFSSQKTDQP